MAFDPAPNDRLQIHLSSVVEEFLLAPHPAGTSFVHAMEGGKATVYRLVPAHAKTSGAPTPEYALKVMRHAFASPELVVITHSLDRLKHLPGLRVCERRCLTPAGSAVTLGQFPELAYAILMPWITGKSWYECLAQCKDGSFTLSQEESLRLARNFCAVLFELERNGMAHCDLSAGNILVDPETLRIDLVDVEDLFAPGFQEPSALPAGTPGYQHRASSSGQWSAHADRFPAAILLCEMLAMCDPDATRAASLESFFAPAELQTPGSRRLPVLRRVVERYSPALAALLDRAWNSRVFAECPAIAEWRRALDARGIEFVPLSAPPPDPTFVPFWRPIEFIEQPETVRFTEPIEPQQAAKPVIRWK